jgi:hypothetical protein
LHHEGGFGEVQLLEYSIPDAKSHALQPSPYCIGTVLCIASIPVCIGANKGSSSHDPTQFSFAGLMHLQPSEPEHPVAASISALLAPMHFSSPPSSMAPHLQLNFSVQEDESMWPPQNVTR